MSTHATPVPPFATTRCTPAVPSASRPAAVVARLLAPVLDHRLEKGVEPGGGRLLTVRAAQLVAPRHRRMLADACEHLLERAKEPVFVASCRVPVARYAVQAATFEIVALAARLRSSDPVTPVDILRVRALLTDGTGPVHTGRGLRETVAAIVLAMDDDQA